MNDSWLEHWKRFVEEEASRRGFTYEKIVGKRRTLSVIHARIEISKILRERGLSYPEIGQVMRRSHSTIMQFVKRTKVKQAYDKKNDQIADESSD